MPREGYSKAFAAALVTGRIGDRPIIPPSVIMVIYGAVAEISVLRLFLGGVVPGILLARRLRRRGLHQGDQGRVLPRRA